MCPALRLTNIHDWLGLDNGDGWEDFQDARLGDRMPFLGESGATCLWETLITDLTWTDKKIDAAFTEEWIQGQSGSYGTYGVVATESYMYYHVASEPYSMTKLQDSNCLKVFRHEELSQTQYYFGKHEGSEIYRVDQGHRWRVSFGAV